MGGGGQGKEGMEGGAVLRGQSRILGHRAQASGLLLL